MVSAIRAAMDRTSSTSGPETRYWIGQPTGGPISSGLTRVFRSEKSSFSTFSSRARTASRTL